MENTDDILKVICENIGDISSLVYLSSSCKSMKDCAISTTLYKEKKQDKYNITLCYKIDNLLISKILKNIRKEDDSEFVMKINEEKKKLNKECLWTLANMIHDDYCDYANSRDPMDHLIAYEKSPFIKNLIIEVDKDYKIYKDNWWIDDDDDE